MATTITDDPTRFDPVVAPSAGDAGIAASIQSLAQELADRTAYLESSRARNWDHILEGGATSPVHEFDLTPRGGDYDPISGIWILGGDTNGCARSVDDGRTFQKYVTGMVGQGTVAIQDIAIGANSSAIAVGQETASDLVYRQSDITIAPAWTSISVGTASGLFYSTVFDVFNDRFIIVGSTTTSSSGPATAEVSDDNTGSAFTIATTVPSGFSTKPFGSVAVKDTASIAVVTSTALHTKFAFSTDGGDVWTDSTTTVVSGRYSVVYSLHDQLFYAARHDSNTSQNVYTSPDGDVWTLVFSGSMGFKLDANATHNQMGVTCLGRAIIVRGEPVGAGSNDSAIAISVNKGVTWSLQRVGPGFDEGPMISSRAQSKIVLTASLNGYTSHRIGQG